MTKSGNNLIDCLAAAHQTKRDLERRIAEIGLGVVEALRKSRMTPQQAWRDLFNLDNFLAMRKRRLDRKLIELFDWGMQLEDVAEVAPDKLPENYRRMTDLAHEIIRESLASPRGRTRQPALRESA